MPLGASCIMHHDTSVLTASLIISFPNFWEMNENNLAYSREEIPQKKNPFRAFENIVVLISVALNTTVLLLESEQSLQGFAYHI